MNRGIDIGGTFIKAGVVNNGNIIKKISIPTEVSKGRERVIRNIMTCIAEFCDKTTKEIGIGCPGSIDHKSGIVISSTNLPIAGINFPKIIKKKFNLLARIDNDANCFALAEFKYGAGKGRNNMIGITMGTGIGSGVIINEELYIGRNMAAELGHIIIKYDGELCNCGKKGHLEAYIGTKGIQRLFGKKISPEEIFKLAAKGNNKALKTWESVGNYLGVGITNMIHAYDPDIVVIGGSVSNAWRFFSESMIDTVEKLSLFQKTKIVKAKLADAGIIGAAELLKKE